MIVYESFYINEQEIILRELCIDDFNKNYLDLLGQLSKIDKDKINFIDFSAFVNQLNERNKVLIIENKTTEKIVGCATIFIENKIIHNMGKVCHVEDVVVDKSLRGSGIGKILMNFITNYARKMNCYKTILDCAVHNIAFYEKCGFKSNGAQMALYH